MLWLIAAFFVLVGIGFLVSGSGHKHLIMAGALWIAAIFLVARTFAPDGER